MPALPTGWERHRFLVLFAILSTLMGVSVGMGRVATSLYALELGAGTLVLGVISASQNIGSLVMGVPVGLLVERLGPGRLFVIGSVLAGAVYALIPSVPMAGFLLACTTLISFIVPLRFVSMNTVFLSQLQSLGEARAGWYRGTNLLGMFLLGPLLGSAAIAVLSFDGTYRLIGLLFFITLLLSPMVFRRYGDERRPEAQRGNPWRHLRLLVENAALRRGFVVDFFNQAALVFFTFFIVVIAQQRLGISAVAASPLIAVQGGTLILTLLFGGGVSARLGVAGSYRAGFAVMATASFVLSFASGGAAFHAGAALLGVGAGLLQSASLTQYARISASLGRGRIAGLSSLAAPAGGLSGSLIGGLIGHWIGLQSVLYGFALAFVLLLSWMQGARDE